MLVFICEPGQGVLIDGRILLELSMIEPDSVERIRLGIEHPDDIPVERLDIQTRLSDDELAAMKANPAKTWTSAASDMLPLSDSVRVVCIGDIHQSQMSSATISIWES